MKKILILFLLVPNLVFASELQVKTNILGGEYHAVLEVHLISNKDNKIFYYTDNIGMINNQIEYKNPIIIKKDTILNFWAIGENFKSSTVKEEIYSFSYPKTLDINQEGKKLKITNTSKETINIGYRIIETPNLIYEITKNTFIKPKKSFYIDYFLDNNYKVKLISPDKKVIIEKEIKKEVLTKELNKEIEVKIDERIDKITEEEEEESKIENTEEKNTFIISQNIKGSIIDVEQKNNKNNSLYYILGIFIIITFFITLYNIIIVVKTYKKNNK